MRRRRWAVLAAIGAGALVGLSNLPGLGQAAPPGGAVMTRRYDPATATTSFTVDVGRASHATLSLTTCPGARVLRADGPGDADIVETAGGTTITFPAETEGTYSVVLAGDSPGLGAGEEPSGCADAALLIDPAVVERAGAEIGPSTRLTNL